MEDQSNAGPASKRQRIVITNDTSGITTPTASPQNEGVLVAVNKLTKLVEGHPQFISKLERMLEGLYNELEPEVSAATRKQKNEVSCPIYKLPNDELKHICGYVGYMQYGFVACTSYRFHQVYLGTFRNETCTSFRNASVSVSCAKLCLNSTERVDVNIRAKSLFNAATRDRHVHVLQWGDDSGCDLKQILNEDRIASAEFNGHLEAVQYMRTLGFSWKFDTCSNSARNVHLELLKFVRSHHCPWDVATCSSAAENGHLELLKWARAHKCPWDEQTCSDAAWNNHLEVLKWARAHQCPWNKDTCANAALNGHLEMLK